MSLSQMYHIGQSANPASQPTRADQTPKNTGFFQNGSNPSFADFVDTVNPLHHIPVVSSIYEKASGDKISPAAKIAGGLLMGGIIGAAAALADCIIEQATGKSAGENIMASLGQDDSPAKDSESPTDIAQLDASQHDANTAQDLTAPAEDTVDIASNLLDDIPTIPTTSPAQTLAVVVPPNPFLSLAKEAATQAQAASAQETIDPIEVASISRTLWQRMEKVYGESQALEALYKQLGAASFNSVA